jgi:hypothetical protein
MDSTAATFHRIEFWKAVVSVRSNTSGGTSKRRRPISSVRQITFQKPKMIQNKVVRFP